MARARGRTDEYRKYQGEGERIIVTQCSNNVISFKLKILNHLPYISYADLAPAILTNISVKQKYYSECHGPSKHNGSKSESMFYGISVTYWSQFIINVLR